MTQVLRIVIAILTLLTTLALAGGFVWSLVAHMPPIMPVVTGLLTVGFGFFVKHDYDYFFGSKS